MRDYMYPGVAVAVSLGFIGIAVSVGVYEARQWEAFSKAHDCKVIAKESGSTGIGFANGKATTVYIPGKTTYHCDDGINYSR